MICQILFKCAFFFIIFKSLYFKLNQESFNNKIRGDAYEYSVMKITSTTFKMDATLAALCILNILVA